MRHADPIAQAAIDRLEAEVQRLARQAIRYEVALRDAENDLAELRAKVAKMRTVPPNLRIEGSWLVEEVDRHTCGQGEGGHYGAHEPDCGLIPMVDLADLPGWPPTAELEAKVAAVEALAEGGCNCLSGELRKALEAKP